MIPRPSIVLLSVLINEYRCAACPVYHVDLYRLETLQDLYSIGLDELVTSEAIIIIEWAEKLLFGVAYTWRITIEVTGYETQNNHYPRKG